MLQKRLKQMRDEEESRIEAEEVSKAAERFKNVGDELSEWEEKHGKGSTGGSKPRDGRSSVNLPQLGFTDGQGRRPSSSMSLLPPPAIETRDFYDIVPLNSPPMTDTAGTPTTGTFSMMESLKSPGTDIACPLVGDPELESKMQLLAEVKKAREEVRGSLDKLRAATHTPSFGTSGETPGTGSTMTVGASDLASRLSLASSRLLEYPDKPMVRGGDNWEAYVQERKVLSPSPMLSPPTAVLKSARTSRDSQNVPDRFATPQERRDRTASMLEPRMPDFGSSELHNLHTIYTAASMSMRKTTSFQERPSTFHDVPLGQPIIIGSAARRLDASSSTRPPPQRTMTYDELAERHRKRISRLQEPVTAKIREQVDVAEATAQRERQKRLERSDQQHREQKRNTRYGESGVEPKAEEKMEVLRTTDE